MALKERDREGGSKEGTSFSSGLGVGTAVTV